MRDLITSQFQYCSLIWVLHSRQLDKYINKILERVLRITYKDDESTYSKLLEKNYAVTVHTKNLQLLTTDMYKTRNDLNPSFMPNNNECVQPMVRSVGNGTDCVRLKGPQLWQILPQTIRNSEALAHIKHWKGVNFSCKLCRTFFRIWAFL